MRARLAIGVACLGGILFVAGCGSSDSTPTACLLGANAYLDALRTAPNEVKLDGQTPISDCVVKNQQGGDLAAVGTAMVKAATKLNAEATADPGNDANFQLGYLLGAVKRGAADTNGIHTELMRRLGVAAGYFPDNRRPPLAFLHTYIRGFSAGLGSG